MKRIKSRAMSILIVVALIVFGLGAYLTRYIVNGEDWVLHFFDINIKANGTVYDRNGLTLAEFGPNEKIYSDSESTRKAVYHLLGEFNGRIGNSILSNFWREKDSFSLSEGIVLPEDKTLTLTIDSELCVQAYNEVVSGLLRHEKDVILKEYKQEAQMNYLSTHRDLLKDVEYKDEEELKAKLDDILDDIFEPSFTDEDLTEEDYERIEKAGIEASGAVMMLNYKTGEVMCMTSLPALDPMHDYTAEEIAELPAGAFLNRCLSAALTPGSIFKLVTSAAAIETQDDIFDRRFYCESRKMVDGVYITCMREHYSQNFVDALANSCNCAFASISTIVGHEKLAQYTDAYGLTSKHYLNSIVTKAGSFPTTAKDDGETAWSGIGQSTDLVNPYAMLRFVAAIANNGVLVEPTVIAEKPSEVSTQLVKPKTAEILRTMMANNVEKSYYPNWYFPGLTVCGKTGTAEVGNGNTNSWFTGFLDDTDHPYAIIVVLEKGGSGLGYAVPIAGRILQAAVDKY